MKKLGLMLVLFCGLFGCSSFDTLDTSNTANIRTFADYSLMSDNCSQIFSAKGKESFFKKEYLKNSQSINNFATSVYKPDLWRMAKDIAMIDLYAQYHHIKRPGEQGGAGQAWFQQTSSALANEPDRNAAIRKVFSKNFCIQEFKDMNELRNTINIEFMKKGLNHLIIQ